ncbi:TIM barrel protein [Microbacterium kribbense]|uniref:TIM barrel protein n=1 Tax=Microbacterium kribbense TaxID=433645 RepID=A0ABP7GBG1_9MICO
MTRPLGVAHLTLLSLTPPEIVSAATAAGLDFVGIRVRAVTSDEPIPALRPGSPLLRETVMRLKDTGVVVRDIEFLPITPGTGPDDWQSALEAGAALGATALTIAGADTDRSRLLDKISQLTADAAGYGIRPLLEPISYQPIARVTDAAAIARATGAGLMLDPLHIQRGGSDVADVAALDPGLIPMIQLCDAPLAPPSGDRLPALQHEARAQRLQIGEGELPLAALLAATPAGVPVSIEVPHALRQQSVSPHEWIVQNAQAARALIEQADSARDTIGHQDV